MSRCLSKCRAARTVGFRIALGWIALLPACVEHHPRARFLPAEGEELPILHQVAGTHSHESRAMQLVIRDAATLARIPLQDVPVDFAEEMLLIVTLGRVPSDQYSVRIDRVWRQGHRIHVATTVRRPLPGAPLVMASPYCIAVVPRCDLNVLNFAPEPPARERTWGQSEPYLGG